MTALRARLDRLAADNNHNQINKRRAAQIGGGARGDKRRTYRFQDNSIYDQITGKNMTCSEFMKGQISKIW